MYYVRHYFAKGQKLNLKAFQKQNAIDHKPYSIGGRLLEAVPARQPGSIRLGRAVAAQEPGSNRPHHSPTAWCCTTLVRMLPSAILSRIRYLN